MGGNAVSRRPVRSSYDAIVDFFPIGRSMPVMAYALVKFVYRIEDGQCFLDESKPLFHDIRDPEIEPRLLPGSEYWVTKYATDVVVRGKAYAPYGNAVHSMQVSVGVGNIEKNIQVWGKRVAHWKNSRQVIFSDPELFNEVSLTYANAYGGVDGRVPISNNQELTDIEIIRVQADHPGLYPRNPFGKGYVVLPEPAEEVLLPLLEDPDDLLTPNRFIVGDPTLWYRQPLPWCYEYTNPLQFPRFVYLGIDAWFTPPDDERLPEVQKGYLPANYRSKFGEQWSPELEISPRYLQEASLGMVFDNLLENTPFVIKGMHPEEPEITFTLPDSPGIEIEIDGQKESVKPQITNMLIEPAEKLVSLVYIARTEKLPRAFIPGIHGYIPLSVTVNGDDPVIYDTPPTIRDQLKAAASEEAKKPE